MNRLFHAFARRSAIAMGSHWSFAIAVDGLAIQLKLDELLRAVQTARTHLVNLEDCSKEELEALRKEFQRLQARERRKTRQPT